MEKTIRAGIEPKVFVRRGGVLLLAGDIDEKHVDLCLRLFRKYKERWDDIVEIPKERKKWDMGFLARGENGEIKIGGKSGGFEFPSDSEMPVVRAKTMTLLRERYPDQIFVEATKEEEEEWREFRARLLRG